jgi:Helix-turn-helix domain
MEQDKAQSQPPESNTLIIEDQALASGFVQLPKIVLRTHSLSRDAKLLYAILLSYAWQAGRCFPGYKRLCDDMQAGETIVRRYMRELQTRGLLSQRRRGQGQTNIYTLTKISTARLTAPEPSKSEVQEHHFLQDKEEPEEQDANLRSSKVEQSHDEHELSQVRPQTLPDAESTEFAAKPRSGGDFASIGDLIRSSGKAPRIAPARIPSTRSDHSSEEPPPQIRACVLQLSLELGDQIHARSNVTRASNLYSQSRTDESAFVSILYEARSITKDRERQSTVGKPMAYYFKVVEDLLGLRPEGEEAASSGQLEENHRDRF